MTECLMCDREAIGDVMCKTCRQKWTEENKRIDEYVARGHTPHCACRIVWGDGISDGCECGLIKGKESHG